LSGLYQKERENIRQLRHKLGDIEGSCRQWSGTDCW